MSTSSSQQPEVATPEDEKQDAEQWRRKKKNLLYRARDSIFVAKKQTIRRSIDQGEDDDDDDNAADEEEENDDELVELRVKKPKVTFGDLPQHSDNEDDDGGGRVNQAFTDDNGANVFYEQMNIDDNETDDLVPPRWDSFVSLPSEDEDVTFTSDWSQTARKLFKLIAYLLAFALVLFGGMLAKLLLHLMASMTRVDKAVHMCSKSDESLDLYRHYYTLVHIYSLERIAWIWSLYFALIVPDVLLLVRSIRHCLFRNYRAPDGSVFLVIFLTSTGQVLGLSLFVYVVLPAIDSLSGLIFTNSLFLLPAICLFWTYKDSNGYRKFLYATIACIQLLSLLSWPFLLWWRDSQFSPSVSKLFRDELIHVWLIPFVGLLISLCYLENFLPRKQLTGPLKHLLAMRDIPAVNKYVVYQFVSIWKCLLYLFLMLIIQGSLASANGGSISKMIWHLFADFNSAFTKHSIDIIDRLPNQGLSTSNPHLKSFSWAPIIVTLIQVASGYICYETIQFVCRIRIQPFGFALPIHLIVPMCAAVMNLLANLYRRDCCTLSDQIESTRYIFWNVHYNIFDLNHIEYYLILLLWLVTFVGQLVVTGHVWINSHERLAPCEQLFIMPYYVTAILDQSIILNRRRVSDERIASDEPRLNQKDSTTDTNIKIYACATVWHETREELLNMLKSIMRMDKDQCERRLAIDNIEVDPREVDYYEFETHLLVDDAFWYGNSKQENDRHINKYVATMIKVLDEAAQDVHQRAKLKIRPPVKFITPYGGRIEWILPGDTKLVAHLKDKNKIRHRKRWSQVMYMYYLLGFKIFQHEPNKEKQQEMAKNTFLLALDGDINFRPEAVLLLLDRMRIDSNLAAACGRVHPIGSGPIAWYQKFEYAVSHWLQKATEHVFGCVLCSPGCFSLFRASALVDVNVMHRYTTEPTEAIHYVQYDQGEDRWLCTLLLQQGWRVEYCAASDSYTHCPESFKDFYIQRRRWAPSTMANIIDLLSSSKHTVKKNDNISSLYILYQSGLMLGTILSPGTIFLMLVGAMNSSLELRNDISFYINFAPVFVFVLICFFTETKWQILAAQILSTFYVMLMLAVLVSTVIELRTEPFSPSAIFFTSMIIIFTLAAVVHPQEFSCLFAGPIYMLTIPSMYLLLTIYSIINLNVVTWGTRENPQEAEASLKTGEKQPKYMTPQWVHDECVQNAKQLNIKRDENEFWTRFIPKYLKPLLKNEAREKQISKELIQLRNKAVFAFGLINIVFVLLVYLLQLHKDILSINFVTGQTYNGSHFDEESERIVYDMEPQLIKIDPIGLFLIVFFGLILVIQFLGMMLHRLETVEQILANTELTSFKSTEVNNEDDDGVDKYAVNIVRHIVNRSTEADRATKYAPEVSYYNISDEFQPKFFNLKMDKDFRKSVGLRRKSTLRAFDKRRNTVRIKSMHALNLDPSQLERLQHLGSISSQGNEANYSASDAEFESDESDQTDQSAEPTTDAAAAAVGLNSPANNEVDSQQSPTNNIELSQLN